MPAFSFPYGTFANYSPRGLSDLSQKSKNICGRIKSGDGKVIGAAVRALAKPEAAVLQPFLNADTVLIPAPRSSPLVPGALWPAREIAMVLAAHGYGKEVMSLLQRTEALRKSSMSPARDRPMIRDHLRTIRVIPSLLPLKHITIVDDVLTMGRTTAACALLLQEEFPEVEIRIFAMIRTQGLIPEIEEIVDPSTGIIDGDSDGHANRRP